MRTIELYKMESEYVMGDMSNMLSLEEKIKKDEVLLAEIEKDFNKNQDECRSEYIAAKINHLRNKYFYCWLVLKRYFDQAVMFEIFASPDYQKEEMKKHGWMFPFAFINGRITTTGNVDVTTEELYIRNFDRLFDNLFGFTIGEPNSRIDRYYKQAIFNYKNQCYYSCAVSLFPIIESYHQYMTGFNEDNFYKIKDNLSKVGEKIESVRQIYTRKTEYYINLVKQFNDLAENHYFNKSLERKSEPEIINRNRIMHGLFSREISQKDCLQLFCTLSNMIIIKTIIETNDMMNKLFNELEELKRHNVQ